MKLDDTIGKIEFEQGKIILKELKIIDKKIRDCFDFDVGYYQKFGLYHIHPYLFWQDYFTDLNTSVIDKLNDVAKAGILLIENIIYYDRVGDNQEKFVTERALKNMLSLIEREKLLKKLIINYDDYQKQFNCLMCEYGNSLSHESKISNDIYNNQKLVSIGNDKFIKIAKGKSALAKSTLVIMNEFSEIKQDNTELETSLDLYAIAFQFYDDIIDFKVDYNNKKLSYIIYKTINSLNLTINSETSDTLFSTCIQKNVLFEISKEINKYLDLAILCKFQCAGWHNHIKVFQNIVDTLVLDFRKILKNRETQESFCCLEKPFLTSSINFRELFMLLHNEKFIDINLDISKRSIFLLSNLLNTEELNKAKKEVEKILSIKIDCNESPNYDIFKTLKKNLELCENNKVVTYELVMSLIDFTMLKELDDLEVVELLTLSQKMFDSTCDDFIKLLLLLLFSKIDKTKRNLKCFKSFFKSLIPCSKYIMSNPIEIKMGGKNIYYRSSTFISILYYSTKKIGGKFYDIY